MLDTQKNSDLASHQATCLMIHWPRWMWSDLRLHTSRPKDLRLMLVDSSRQRCSSPSSYHFKHQSSSSDMTSLLLVGIRDLHRNTFKYRDFPVINSTATASDTPSISVFRLAGRKWCTYIIKLLQLGVSNIVRLPLFGLWEEPAFAPLDMLIRVQCTAFSDTKHTSMMPEQERFPPWEEK